MCLVRMSACFVPLWNFRRIHSPGALKLEEAEAMERQRTVVPAGREFLCRRDILGVPGVLDGLSHVVSDGVFRRRNNDIRRAAAAVVRVCHFGYRVGSICGQR